MFSALIEHLHSPAFCTDRSGLVLFANQRLRAALQHPSAEISGNPVATLRFGNPSLSGLGSRLKETIGEALGNGKMSDFSHKEYGTETGISILIDHTAPAEKAAVCIILKCASEQCEPTGDLPALIPGPAFAFAPDGLLTGWNSDASSAVFGLGDERPKGLNLFEATHPEDREVLRKAVTAALRGEPEASCEARIRHGGRTEYRWHSVRARAVMTGDKPSLVATCAEITRRKQLEEELQSSRSQLDFALQKSHIGWWSLNIENGSAFRTIEYARIFGYDSTDQAWSLQTFLDHVVDEDRDRVRAAVEHSRSNRSGLNLECRIRRADGELRWIMVTGDFQHDDAHGRKLMSGIVMDISERKSVEIELQDNRVKFDLALKAARAGIWEMKLENNQLVWSNEIEHLLGIEEQTGSPSLDLWIQTIHPDDRQMINDNVMLAIQEEKESSLEYRVCWPDGSIHWLMSRGQPVRNGNGKLTGFTGTVIDITERRELHESVRQRESEYRSLFENMPNGFAYCQLLYDEHGVAEDFVFLEVNQRFEELIPFKNVAGKRATQLIPEIRSTDNELFVISQRIVNSAQPEHFDYFMNALQEWFAFSVYSPKPDFFIVIFDVITRHKQIEQSLRESERKYRTITEQISEVVFVADMTGTVTYISPSIEKTGGYKPEEIIGQIFFQFLAEDEVERSKQQIVNALTKGVESEVFEMKYRKKDGSILHGEVSVRYFLPENGKTFSGMIGVIRDISCRKKTEEEKKRLELQLQKAERLETVGRLAGGIAHDFNNLLSPMLGYAELGMLSAAEEGYNPEYYTAIVQAAERAKQLISQILTFSKAHESKPVAVKVQPIIEEAVQLLRPSIPANIRIEPCIDQTCRTILIDPSKLHQMLVNLCTNAWQAIDKSNGVITITLREVIPGKTLLKKLPDLTGQPYAELSVSDNGIGMDKATIEHIFEPFFTTKSANMGCGLGLSVVHGIVTSYKGDILVESTPGESTSFRIYLPVIEQSPEQQIPNATLQQGKGCILFVDDEQVILNMIKTMLTKQGFKVCAVKNPLEAIKLFRQDPGRFDLVITDLTMPELSGIELSRELKNIRPSIPIILMTGFGKDLNDAQSLNEYGICKMLKKPVRLVNLVSAINDALSGNC